MVCLVQIELPPTFKFSMFNEGSNGGAIFSQKSGKCGIRILEVRGEQKE